MGTWALLTVAGAAFSIFVALVIYVYRWMDSVKDNHLTRIQAAVEQTARHTHDTDARLLELAIREEERHAVSARQLAEMTTLIRTRGL